MGHLKSKWITTPLDKQNELQIISESSGKVHYETKM